MAYYTLDPPTYVTANAVHGVTTAQWQAAFEIPAGAVEAAAYQQQTAVLAQALAKANASALKIQPSPLHDFTDRYCVLKTAKGIRQLCKHCGCRSNSVLAAVLCQPIPDWREDRESMYMEMMDAPTPTIPVAPEAFPRGHYEPLISGAASIGCRMVHRDRVR